ncbi:hypothetical protein [Marinisporobacter balticus]|uniref:Uncharacterized protein n=1 Tax=Marinisporobacter balticus TaxID=2018667 RepID=A0A4R2K9U6_9FIRM|nr:hypothetical protein [Marinisporobacter balticus]TCO69524.1 hypothetical protein EV214_13148 [Marinisporobacter balticus]
MSISNEAIEKVFNEVKKEILKEEAPKLNESILNALKKHANENNKIDTIELITSLAAFTTTLSMDLSLKITVASLKKLLSDNQ